MLLPSEAVMIGQNGRYVYIVKSDSTIGIKNVKVGQTYDHKYTSIQSGISLTDNVVVQGQLNLYPGMKVAVKETTSDHKKD